MSSEYVNTSGTPPSFHCAAGVYCQMPHVDYVNSPHKCFFCKKLLHGICGVLHDPDDITYHNRCNGCNRKYFMADVNSQSVHLRPPLDRSSQPLQLSPVEASSAAYSSVQLSSAAQLSSDQLTSSFHPVQSICRLSMNSSSGASTPCFNSRATTPTTFGDSEAVLDENGVEEDESIPIPDWFALDIGQIYDHLNPRTKQGQVQQRGWRKRAVDATGKPLTSIGLVANRLLKVLVTKKLISDSPLNMKLQSKKVDWEQQKKLFLGLQEHQVAVQLVRKFLAENIFLPVNADGNVINVEEISVNVGARVIMLAADPETYDALVSIFSSPAKEERRAHVDNKALSFNDKWNALAAQFMNAPDFSPENIWANDDSRISDVDPRLPPSSPWSGEDLRKHFRSLKTKFALVDEVFCRSGNLEAGADIDEADRFDGHIRRLLPNESPDMWKLLLFAFWVFDKAPPKFISRAKPEDQQFDTSAPASDKVAKEDKDGSRKRMRAVQDSESLAKAVASLASSEEEQKEKLKLLREQQLHVKDEEERKKFSWKRSECEKFLMASIPLNADTKEKLQSKMNELAENFLNDNF
jgi:hypothetical protein